MEKEPQEIFEGQVICPNCNCFKLQLLAIKTNNKDKTILHLVCLLCGTLMLQPLGIIK